MPTGKANTGAKAIADLCTVLVERQQPDHEEGDDMEHTQRTQFCSRRHRNGRACNNFVQQPGEFKEMYGDEVECSLDIPKAARDLSRDLSVSTIF